MVQSQVPRSILSAAGSDLPTHEPVGCGCEVPRDYSRLQTKDTVLIRSETYDRSTMAPQGPYKLVTVNTAPERAKRLVGRVVEDIKDQYTVIHAANVECKNPIFGHLWNTKANAIAAIAAARETFEKIMPDIVVCISFGFTLLRQT